MLNLSLQHPHQAMRRDEREITDPAEIMAIIHASRVMYLALADHNQPFLVPVFFAWVDSSIYFHSAKAGSKVDILNKNSAVCFAVSVDQGVIESDIICNFEAQHRTVIGFAEATFVDDNDEKIKALDHIVARFTDKKFSYPQANLKSTLVIRLDGISMKGKKHGF